MNPKEFATILAQKGIELTAQQLQQFEQYFELLVEWNQKMNLTAITEQEEVYLKHFYDSLMPLWLVPERLEGEVRVVDIGAGAGFPGIPLKIAQPDLQLTMVDSLNKRVTFLNEVIDQLGLTHTEAIHARAEDFGHDRKHREQYDISIARAVAGLNVLAEYCLPLVRKGGYFIALKGQKAQQELEEAQGSLLKLGAKYEGSHHELLPIEESEREILSIRKTLNTPNKYPRKAGKPTKSPLK